MITSIIKVGRSGSARIDADDLPLAQASSWHLWSPSILKKPVAARIAISANGKMTRQFLHRLIAGPGEDQLVVFLNGNPLDCRRSNLHVIPRGQYRKFKRTRK